MALIQNGKISLISYLLGLSILMISVIGAVDETAGYLIEDYWRYLLAAYAGAVNVILLFLYRGRAYKVAWRGGLLGLVSGCGLMLSISDTTWRHFGWYITLLSFFHFSEYFVTAVTNPMNLSLDSYLLDHSMEYKVAALASWAEFTIEWMIFPGMKQLTFISVAGLLLVIFGELLRKAAMFTAMSNFNHYVRHVKEEGHQLVTNGVYAFCRHPSYVGWFYWSVGTQIILCNPLCIVGYTVASWRFFKTRIEDEEITLLNFFGEHYLEYQKKVGTGLPLIEGYRMEL